MNKFNKFPVVILAAGYSKRMGKPKGLLEYKEKPFILSQITNLRSIGFEEIVIVLGKSKDTYFEKISELKKYNIVINPSPEIGVFSSIQCGLANLSKENIGVFILPIDVPSPKKYVWEEMLENFKLNQVNVVVPSFNGKKGHPVLLSSEFKKYILSCNPSSRLDYEIHKQENQQKVKIISVKDSTILLNLNTKEDWEAFKVL